MTVLLCLYSKALCSIKGNEKYLHGFAQSASLAEKCLEVWNSTVWPKYRAQRNPAGFSDVGTVKCWPDPDPKNSRYLGLYYDAGVSAPWEKLVTLPLCGGKCCRKQERCLQGAYNTKWAGKADTDRWLETQRVLRSQVRKVAVQASIRTWVQIPPHKKLGVATQTWDFSIMKGGETGRSWELAGQSDEPKWQTSGSVRLSHNTRWGQ